MKVVVLNTDGHALEALAEVEGMRLLVMDDVTMNDGPAPLGPLDRPRLSALLLDGSSFIDADPRDIGLVSCGGWSYDATGVLRTPDVLEVGSIAIHIGNLAGRPAGATVMLRIDRLDLSVDR